MQNWWTLAGTLGLAIAVLFLGAGAHVLAQQAPADQPASEEAAVELDPLGAARMALARNLDLQAQEEAIAEARAQLQQAFSINKLKAGLQGSVMRMGPVTSISLPAQMGGMSIEMGADHDERATVSLTQPIYTGKRAEYATSLARQGVDMAASGYEAARRQFALAAQETAYGALRTQQLAAIAEARVNAVVEHVKIAQAMQEEGLVAAFDVVQAQTELARAEGDRIAARTAIDQVTAALRNIVNVPQTAELTVRDGPSLPGPEGALSELIEVGWEQRPEVRVAAAGVRLAQANVRLAAVDLKPSVALTGQYTRSNATGTSGSYSWQIGVVVDQPLLDGGAKSARVREAQAKLRVAELGLASAREQVALEVHQHFLSVDEAGQKIETAGQGVVEARERQRMAQLRYREGLAAGIEVIDADTALAAAQASLVNAQYDLALAIARLRSATGIVDAEEVEPE